MRIAADGFIDAGDYRVRTPGKHEERFDPMPLGDGLAFLFSHTFPGHRVVVRPPSPKELSLLQHAVWADGISDRMDLVDRVWRAVTTPAAPPPRLDRPALVQVVEFSDRWGYPIHFTYAQTLVPDGGDPLSAVKAPARIPRIRLAAPHDPALAGV